MRILTFDIEEWFHILDNNSTKFEANWDKYEVRIFKNMERIFAFLDKNKIKATFFVVGWIAKKYPQIIKEIDSMNFEIGSHTHLHQLMYEQNYSNIYQDIKKSIYTIENITGKKVRSFRAPGFSIIEKNKWVFEILSELGISHDCSVFPANRAHGGMPKFNNSTPTIISYNGVEIKEFPINTINYLNKPLVFSGGGYFRITPYFLIKYWTKKSEYIMTYFHPRDFDPNQPMIKELSLFRKFKSYIGLKSSLNKLERWVNDFKFVDLKEADSKINWSKVKRVNL